MRLHHFAFFVAVTFVAGCERRRPPDPHAMVQRTMKGVLAYPKSVQVSVSAGEDAAQVTMTSQDSAGKVADWFRRSLAAGGWTLTSDVTSADGSTTISATQGKRPLWITFQRNEGAPGTTYTVIGAVVAGDSVVAQQPREKP
jgi:hypothetical protein